MRQRFYKTLVEHRLVAKGDRILVGLSGGPDSVVLLDLLRAVQEEFSLEMAVAHLDHGIRAGSGEDHRFVAQLCRQWNFPLTAEKVDIPAIARNRKAGLEEAAREVRHDFLNRTARTWNCNRIALGHNRGDQAETLIHRLVRGVGPPGLAAMRFREDRIIRPLLAFSRGEIIAYLQQRDIEFRTDPTNYDTRYTRNRIRHEILPLLALVNPQVEKQLFQLSRLAAEDEDCWQEAVSGFLPAVWTGTAEGGELEVQPLRQAHSALRKRVIRFCLALVRGDLAGLGQAQIEAVDALLFSTSPHAEIDLKGCWAGRNYGRLCLQPRRPAAPADYCFCIDGPGELAIPDLGCLQVSGPELPQGEDRWEVEFSAEALSFPLLIRSFRAGDTFRPAGMNGRKKLKNLFIDLKIERFWRARIPLVTTPAGEIVWVVGVRRSALFRPSGGDSRVLRLAFRPENGYKNLSL